MQVDYLVRTYLYAGPETKNREAAGRQPTIQGKL